MKNISKKILAVFVMCLFSALLSGCIGISSIDDMFALPQLPSENFELQEAIDAVLESNAEYSAPTSGSNRSAVQLVDLNGDGEKEAVACLKVSGDEKPLKIYIFRYGEDGIYSERLAIEGEGTSIESLAYTDMDGDGVYEIAVGWQISSDLKILCVYSIKGVQVSSLIQTEYTAYTAYSLGGGSGTDIVAVKLTGAADAGEVTAYSLMKDGEVVSSSTYLSKGIMALSRVRTNYLNDGKAAVYIESTTGGSVMTDIIIYKDDHIENVTLEKETGVSETTARTYSVYSMDINGDGIIEVPKPELLPSQAETNTSYYMLKWYTYDSRNERKLALTTYHNYSDGWYLRLPEDWVGKIGARRADGYSGERAIVFSLVKSDGTFEDFLKIYTLTGENRREKAMRAGRFVIYDNDSASNTIYAGEILVNAYNFDIPLSMELIQSEFKIIYSEWVTGEI